MGLVFKEKWKLSNGTKVSYYDRLFTFGRYSLEIFTKWEKYGCIYGKKRKIEDYFKINNSM